MTREDIYASCLDAVSKSKALMMELATGYGKTKLAIDLINHLCETVYKGKKTSMLLLVAKRVHKQTWKDEFEKWGGIKVDTITSECYESLKKHVNESFTFIVMDEVHHIKSDARISQLETLHYDYLLGLSATIPKKINSYFRYRHHAITVSCDIVEAIEDDVLPEPTVLLLPLHLDNSKQTETWEINPKASGPIVYGKYEDYWKLKRKKVHALISMTPFQKLKEFDSLISWEKDAYIRRRNPGLEKVWLHHCGKRLEFLAYCKNDIVNKILAKLKNYRTITFCKNIEQSEILGKNCIHSKNKDATSIYEDFNNKKIKHITAVNILNENANLVDCKYAIFANISSSEVVIPQRLGRAMRHKSPVIVVPFYVGTREQEIVKKMFENYNQEFIKTITSINEI